MNNFSFSFLACEWVLYLISFSALSYDFLFKLSDIEVQYLFMCWFWRISLVFNCFICCIDYFWWSKDFTTINAEVYRRLVPEYWNNRPRSGKIPNRWLLNTLDIRCAVGLLISKYSSNKVTLSYFSLYAIISRIWCSSFVDFPRSGFSIFHWPENGICSGRG